MQLSELWTGWPKLWHTTLVALFFFFLTFHFNPWRILVPLDWDSSMYAVYCILYSEHNYILYLLIYNPTIERKKPSLAPRNNIQDDQINMASFSWHLVKSSSVRVFCSVHWRSNFLQGTRKTRPCLSCHPVYVYIYINMNDRAGFWGENHHTKPDRRKLMVYRF